MPGGAQLYGLLSANVLNNLVSFALTIVAARTLGLGDFGLFTLAVTITLTVSQLLATGHPVTLVRLYTLYSDAEERATLTRVILTWHLFLIGGVIVLLPLLIPATQHLLPVLAGAFALTLASLVSGSLLNLWNILRALEQSRKDFTSYSRQTLLYAGLRLTAAPAAVAILGVTPFAFFVGLYLLPLTVLLAVSWSRHYRRLGVAGRSPTRAGYVAVLRELWKYGAWVAASSILYNLLFRLPQMFLSRRAEPRDLGLYGAAFTFLAAFSLLNDTLRTLLLPRVAGLDSDVARTDFRTRFWRRSPLFLLILLAGVGVLALIQWTLLGATYRESVPLFAIIGVAVVIAMQFGLANMLVHSYGVPQIDTAVNLARVLVLLGTFAVIPPTALATSITVAAVLVTGEVALTVALRHAPQRYGQAGTTTTDEVPR